MKQALLVKFTKHAVKPWVCTGAGHPDGWNIAYYIFTFMRGILFFTVVVLVGTGWSYMKPLLAEKEKRILMIVIPLQVFAEVRSILHCNWQCVRRLKGSKQRIACRGPAPVA